MTLKPFFVAVFLITLAHGATLQAATSACPSAAHVNAALKKCGSKNVGACVVQVGPWSGIPYGATKPLTVRTQAKLINSTCLFHTTDAKVRLYLCNPGPCRKR